MCFFIGGVQPRMKTLDASPRRCPVCGLQQAYLQRVDHYLSLFFIPLLPVKHGDPFLFCRHCQNPVDDSSRADGAIPPPSAGGSAMQCPQCGRRLEGSFKYCPYCGQRRF